MGPQSEGDETREAVEEQAQQGPEELSPSGLPIQEPMWVCVTKPCPTLRVTLSDFNDSIGGFSA